MSNKIPDSNQIHPRLRKLPSVAADTVLGPDKPALRKEEASSPGGLFFFLENTDLMNMNIAALQVAASLSNRAFQSVKFSGCKLFPASSRSPPLPCSGPIPRPFPFGDHPPAKESSPSLCLYLLPPCKRTSGLSLALHCSSRLVLSLLFDWEPVSGTVACCSSSSSCCLAGRLYGHHLICSEFKYNHIRGCPQCSNSAAVTRAASSSVASRRHGFLMGACVGVSAR